MDGLGKGSQVQAHIVSPGLVPRGFGSKMEDRLHAQCAGGKARTHLFWGYFSIFIKIHVFKKASRRILIPHKQVACGQAILSGYQLHLK